MKELKLDIHLKVFKINELPLDEQNLCQAAIDALQTSYSPYSDFKVGSAVMLEDGQIIAGSNQENAVYPLGLCAERVAIFSAASRFPRLKMTKIAVTTAFVEEAGQLPPFPCGSCRHVIFEQETRCEHEIKVFVISRRGEVYVMTSIKDILPFAFSNEFLK